MVSARRVLSVLGMVIASLATASALGMGGHYVVDDAALADPRRCEVYGWYSRGGSNDQALEAELACNPLGNFELTLGVGRFKDAGGWDTGLALEGKTLFKEPAIGSWGWGLVGRSEWRDTLSSHENVQLYVPVTLAINDHVLLHVNGGGVWERNDSNAFTWGAAADVALTPELSLIAETYGTHRGGTEYQVGLRNGLGAGFIDFSYGWTRSSFSDNWFTVGLAWMF